MNLISKKIEACVVSVVVSLALLCGCVRQTTDTVVWEKSLENSGATVDLSNCNATETKSLFWEDPERDPIELLTIEADGVPVMDVEGIEPENLELYFAAPHETGTFLYTMVKPVLNVDYREMQPEDGTVQYRLETVYTYYVVVKTEQGTDRFLLKCTRQV